MIQIAKEQIQDLKNTLIALQNNSNSQKQYIQELICKINEANIQIQKQKIISFASIHRGKIKFPYIASYHYKPKVSIIIPVWNQYEYTKACLYSIYNSLDRHDYEVIIADDCSTDNTFERLKKDFENIIYFKTHTNVGFLDNVRNAVEHSRGKYIMLMNNDIIPQDNWLTPLLETFKLYPSAGIVGGMFIDIDNKIQEAGSKMSKNGVPQWLGFGEDINSEQYNKLKEVDYCSGCGIMFKREDWDKVGGFDRQFAPAYYEDADLSMSFKHVLGLKTYYQPKSRFVHIHNVSYGNTNYTSQENKVKFLNKWLKELKEQS